MFVAFCIGVLCQRNRPSKKNFVALGSFIVIHPAVDEDFHKKTQATFMVVIGNIRDCQSYQDQSQGKQKCLTAQHVSRLNSASGKVKQEQLTGFTGEDATCVQHYTTIMNYIVLLYLTLSLPISRTTTATKKHARFLNCESSKDQL